MEKSKKSAVSAKSRVSDSRAYAINAYGKFKGWDKDAANNKIIVNKEKDNAIF